ncbi:MAG: hypothetical protein ACHP9Z_00345 [Streptosporangiales bacterium]
MELREIGNRLFWLHARLIITVFLVGLAGGLALYLSAKPTYQASAIFVMGAQDPQSAEEAAVLADTARGIATGPQLVDRAISEAGVIRSEPAVVAGINVQTLGSSGVLTLSVTDPDPQAAMRLANGLAAGVVSTRIALIQNGLASSLRNLARQEASTDAQIQKLSAQVQALATQSGATSPQAAGQLAQLQARLTSLQQEATQIAVQRNDLEATQGPKTTVLDRAVSATRVPGRGLIDTLLGGILGLVVGIALAGAREMLRPSLVGASAITRAVGTPLLGEMNSPPDSWTLAALPDAGTYIELAADAQHVNEVRFAALDPDRRRGAQVRMLEGPLHRLRFGQSPGTNLLVGALPNDLHGEQQPAAAAPGGPADLDAKNSPRTGLVVAIPRVLKLADVDALTNFMWISGWTLLGAIVYSPSKKPVKPALRHPDTAGSPEESSLGQVEVDR